MRSRLAGIPVALALSACSHPNALLRTDLSDTHPSDSGVLVIVRASSVAVRPPKTAPDPRDVARGFVAEPKKEMATDCGLDLRAVHGTGQYTVPFEPEGVSSVLVHLPPGEYSIHGIRCSEASWGLGDRGWPTFLSYAGRIGVLQPLDFRYVGNLRMAADRLARDPARQEIARALGRLPAEAQRRLTSAYGNSPVTIGMLATPALGTAAALKHGMLATPALGPAAARNGMLAVEYTSSHQGLAEGAARLAGAPSFASCYRSESRVNSLWLGDVDIEARFESGYFKGLDVRPTAHTFSPRFVDCVKARIEKFQPRLQADLTYRFAL